MSEIRDGNIRRMTKVDCDTPFERQLLLIAQEILAERDAAYAVLAELLDNYGEPLETMANLERCALRRKARALLAKRGT